MIRRTVSAALLLRDGFTRKPLPGGCVVRCTVDDVRCAAVRKAGGYLVLMDLPAGAHTVKLQCASFREETLHLETAEGSVAQMAIDLRPGRGYPFPPGTAFLDLALGVADTELWAGMSGAVKLTVAQAKAGEDELQLIVRGPRERLPLPGCFLLGDGKSPELVQLCELDSSGTSRAAQPLGAAHARGTELLPARRFVTDASGRAELSFPSEGKVLLCCAGSFREAELKQGRQELSWTPGKK